MDLVIKINTKSLYYSMRIEFLANRAFCEPNKKFDTSPKNVLERANRTELLLSTLLGFEFRKFFISSNKLDP